MRKCSPFGPSSTRSSPLDEIIRDGAQQMLQSAIEAEVSRVPAAVFGSSGRAREPAGRSQWLPANTRVTHRCRPTGGQQPRVRDKTSEKEKRVTFSSSILPPYLRRSKTIDELIPWLYLKGISTGDFQEALQSLLGEDAQGISANVVVRLKEKWGREYDEWSRRDLSDKQYVYLWADGIHANVRLEDEANQRQCMLVLMGATADGHKELIAVVDGYRESKQSWYELLVDLKHRGLKERSQAGRGRWCVGILGCIARSVRRNSRATMLVPQDRQRSEQDAQERPSQSKADLHEIWMAATREQREQGVRHLPGEVQAKYPAACECLEKDRDVLLTFYDFPAEHWKHLRTTNPIESTFATIRLRHRRTKGCGTRRASLTMMFKLAESAQKKWRR